MSAKSQTTATFAVTLVLPNGVNLQDMQDHIRNAVQEWDAGKNMSIDDNFVRVYLIRKVTEYGKH